MDLSNKRYVILELIPTSSDPSFGDIAQISALKINGLMLESRFDYRLVKEKISIPDILDMINYDNDSFKYVKTTKKMLSELKKFVEDLPILVMDDSYTRNYLSSIKNSKESILSYLNLDFSFDVFDVIMKKYNLEPSCYLVDILYEALIREIN